MVNSTTGIPEHRSRSIKIRSYTWGNADLSWSVVMEELLHAAELRGHTVDLISTNGTTGMRYWDTRRNSDAIMSERAMIRNGHGYDLDIVYTVPQNFPQRFLKSSRVKMARYDYESSHMPQHWTRHYSLVDYMIPSSDYVVDMLVRNGCPKDKIRKVPYGIDPELFNRQATPFRLQTEKGFKFLCIAAPHDRKQLPALLKLYFETFSDQDDVCLVIKTTLFKDKSKMKPFEIDIRAVYDRLLKKHGNLSPAVEFVTDFIPDIASLYTACDAFALMTASEGWGMPFLESIACGLITIAPRFGGQLEFLNDTNAVLTACGTRLARKTEQYWGVTDGATTGSPDPADFSAKMMGVYRNSRECHEKLSGGMQDTVSHLSWDKCFQSIEEIIENHE